MFLVPTAAPPSYKPNYANGPTGRQGFFQSHESDSLIRRLAVPMTWIAQELWLVVRGSVVLNRMLKVWL